MKTLPIPAALAVVLTLGATDLAAQPATPGSPAHAPSLDTTSWALQSNPANLSFTGGFFSGLVLRGFEDAGDVPAASWVIGGGTDGGVGGALGIDTVRGASPHVRLSLGLAAGTEHVSFGFASRRWYAPRRVGYGSFRSTDAFVGARLNRWLGASAGITNIGVRRLDGSGTDRNYRVGIGLREPHGRFELDLSWQSTLLPIRVGQRVTASPTATAMLSAAITPGAAIWATGEATTRDRFDLASIGFGVRVGLGPTSIRTGVRASHPGDDSQTWAGILGFDIALPEPDNLLPDRDRLLRIQLGPELAEVRGLPLLGPRGVQHTDLLVLLDRIGREGRIGGVFIESAGLRAGTAQIEELRASLMSMRDGGMLVVMHLHDATVRDLYLATAADFVTISPLSATLDAGISTSRVYLAGLLDTFGIDAQFVRIGDYKSGPERFTRSGPSELATESLDAYLDDVWAELRRGLLDGSDIEAEELDAALQQVPLFPEWLREQGYVDAIAHLEDAQREIEAHFDRRFSFPWDYESAVGRGAEWFPSHRIAVLHINGSIVGGTGGINFLSGGMATGSATIERACRAILQDRSIDGVIVRIDSPGGSATASDDMLRALQRLSDELPVVVSMGDVAASGGYYAASIGVDIFASKSTLTGSIGIYAGTFAVEELLGAFGIARVFSDRGGPSGFFNGRHWDEQREAAMQRSIASAYDIFLDHVATSRDRTTAEIDEVARGRIWSGADAVDVGLVDHLGGFPAALDQLRESIGVPERAAIDVVHFPQRRGLPLVGALVGARVATEQDGSDALGAWLHEHLGSSVTLRAVLALLEGADGALQARLEWELDGL